MEVVCCGFSGVKIGSASKENGYFGSVCFKRAGQFHGAPACRGRESFTLTTGGAGRHQWALASLRKKPSQVPPVPHLRPREMVEKLWQEFFMDPTEWWDNRPGKSDPKYPDFKHKETKHSLWLNGRFKPWWVDSELAAIPPGTIRSDLMTWNKILVRYLEDGQYEKTITVYQHMLQDGINVNSYTFVAVLKACSGLRALEVGRQVHQQIINSGYQSHVHVVSCLLEMYFKCRSINDAWKLFTNTSRRDVVLWSSMILGCSKSGQWQQALKLSRVMVKEGVEPNHATFVAILTACASGAAIDEGRRVHAQIIQRGFESDVVMASSLIDMYTKCGSIEDAWAVFQKVPERNVVAWSAMILGFRKCGEGQKALELFWQMEYEGVEPNPFTFVGVLNACASVGALEEGQRIHDKITQKGGKMNVFVGNSLIDMYAKCGNLEDALKVFNKMPKRNVVSWTAVLGGYAIHGQAKEAVEHFERMSEQGVKVNDATFVTLLLACSHSGLVDEALYYFRLMREFYKISPTLHHYALMVDLLGRAGRLLELEDLIKMLPMQTDDWMSLVHACRGHGSAENGERIAERLLELELENSVSSVGPVIPSEVYVACDLVSRNVSVQRQRLERAMKADKGCSWIEVNESVHAFTADDESHPQLKEIHLELSRLSGKMDEERYLSGTKGVAQCVDEKGKIINVCHHTQKLAVALGLISTPPGDPLRIFKNGRMCGNCHTATKFFAEISERLILVRDGNRFHYFAKGHCSCNDYW